MVILLYYFEQIIFDYWTFYKLNKIKFKPVDLCLSLYFILGFVLTLSNFWWGSLISVGEISLFYMWFRKKAVSKNILSSMMLITVLDMLQEILFELLEEDTDNMMITLIVTLIMMGSLIVIACVINHFLPKIKKILFKKNDNSLLYLWVYLYLSMQGWYALVTLQKSQKVIGVYLIGEIILQLTFVMIAYFFYRKLTKKLLDKRKQDQIQQHIKDIEEYSAYLEREHKNNQSLRHDLNNLLFSMSKDDVHSTKQFSKYLQEKFPEDKGKNYTELKNVKIKEVKSLLITKFAKMNQANISWTFECENEVRNLPDSTNVFDIIRIVGIALDNAIEASVETKKPFIQIMIFSEKNLLEFEVRNNFQNKVNIEKIKRSGFSTKDNHLGIGLSNIQEIIENCQGATFDIWVEKEVFDFYVVIDNEKNSSVDM